MKAASAAVLALLVASPAFAQTTTPAPAPSTPPAATAPSGNLSYYKHTPGQMRASKLIGTNVKNQANETIGEINELILDKDGKVAAVVIGVGGFLGIGQREVALDYKSLNIKYDPNAMTDAGATTVMVNATKESIMSAPAWTWNRDSNAGGTTTAPRTAPTPSGTTR
jgi:sporulation protein YlmC with PRC-barrel domain